MKFMKNYFLTCCFVFLSSMAFSQRPNNLEGREIPSIATIEGIVVDQTTGLPIEYANVVLISRRDSSMAAGGITDSKGSFKIENIKLGRYRLKVSFLGYQAKVIDSVMLSFKEPKKDFGMVSLQPSIKNLNEVQVSAEREAVETSLDKKVYNVEKMMNVIGGTAVDVLAQIPSINVDVEGNVSLRGSNNFTILIDGKPSGMMAANRDEVLAQIPANTIDRIEVVTTPSARYDAEGTTGIINVVLKKNKLDGLNGSLQVGAGTGDKFDGSLNLSYRYKKLNAFVSYSYRHDLRFRKGFNNRFNTLADTAFYNFQDTYGNNLSQSNNLRAGFDYDISPKLTLGHSSTYSIRNNSGAEGQGNFFRDQNFNFQDYFTRGSFETRKNDSYDGTLSLKYKFAKPRQELSADFTYSNDVNYRNGEYQNRYFFANGTSKPRQNTDQFIRPDGSAEVMVAQLDYTQPVKKSRLEAGFKQTNRSLRSSFLLRDFDTVSNTWVTNTLRSNDFKYSDQVTAAYLSWGTLFKGIKIQAGLRSEYTQLQGELLTNGKRFSQEYLSFFPSMFLVKEFKDKGQEVSLNYSRRISRPDSRALNPFIDYSDPINLRTGNSSLQPEFTHSFELGYLKQAEKFTFTSSLFARRTDNSVSRFRRFLNDSSLSILPGSTLTTMENIAISEALGVETNLKNQWSKQLESNFGFSWNYNRILANNLENNLSNSGGAFDLRLMIQYKLTKLTSFQINSNYSSARPTAQGSMRPIYGTDISIKREFLKKKNLILTVNLSDIFDTRQFQFDMQNQFFQQDFLRKRETRVLSASLVYRLGRQDLNQIMRRGRRSGGSGDYNAGGGEE
jgi:outer membrane receptor protein involved in Fe transport